MKNIFCFIFILFALSTSALAQVGNEENKEGQQSSLSFDFELPQGLGAIYFQDQIGLQAAFANIPIEGFIDTETYILGAQDLITIDIKATQSILLRGIIINPQGDIVLPIGGALTIKGKTLAEAETLIKQRVAETYPDPSVTITLDQPRAISVHVTGDVPHPGKYILPAQSRVDFAIFQALTDGIRKPSPTASYSASDLVALNFSLRNIDIRSEGGLSKNADLISYYRTGGFDKNPFVQDGDVITIFNRNPESARISISGAVKTPLEIEFLNIDTPQSLLTIAGEFHPDADTTLLLLFRNNNERVERIKIEPEDWDSFELEPNDRIIATFNRDRKTAASAWISGEVHIPGNFPIIDGVTTALDLLDLADDLTDQALPHAAYLIRAGDIKNQVPEKFNTEALKRTSDQVVQGLQYLDLETKLSQNQVFIDLTNRQQLQSVKIFDGDRLFVPRDERTVFVFGQVNNPGYFAYDQTKSANDFITQAGGFSLSADLDRIFIVKAGNKTWYKPKDTTIESGDMIFIDRIPVDELNAQRNYDIQKRQLRISNTQIILTAITTMTAIVTTIVAIRR